MESVCESPEQVTQKYLEELFGLAFAQAYESEHSMPIEQLALKDPKDLPNLMARSLAKDIKSEQLPGGKIKFIKAGGERQKEPTVYAVVEHNILDDKGEINKACRVVEIINLGEQSSYATSPNKEYECKDILWINPNNGKTLSFRKKHNISEGQRIRLKPGMKLIGCNISGAGSVIPFLTTEESISALHHESVGHPRHYQTPERRMEITSARSRIEGFERRRAQGISPFFAGRTSVEEFRGDLDIYIKDEQEAWRLGNEAIEETITDGFSIVSDDYKRKLEEYRKKFLATYQESFKYLCDQFKNKFDDFEP